MKMNKITTFSVILLGVIIPPPKKKQRVSNKTSVLGKRNLSLRYKSKESKDFQTNTGYCHCPWFL